MTQKGVGLLGCREGGKEGSGWGGESSWFFFFLPGAQTCFIGNV